MGRGTSQSPEGLINRINLQFFHPRFEGGHQALAHVGIKAVIGAAHDHLVLLQLPLHLEVGRSHGNAQGAGFGAARDDATVVIGKHNQGPADDPWIEHRFAGGIEIVAIDEHDRAGHGPWQSMPL